MIWSNERERPSRHEIVESNRQGRKERKGFVTEVMSEWGAARVRFSQVSIAFIGNSPPASGRCRIRQTGRTRRSGGRETP
jgi:hypothetical protein